MNSFEFIAEKFFGVTFPIVMYASSTHMKNTALLTLSFCFQPANASKNFIPLKTMTPLNDKPAANSSLADSIICYTM
ncbi:hypothetical protein [Pseudomonas capsici]|uniref:hypothetical protein n=1 Tax=Pseudomonas capsici TaxID=2810614 RepID=UPI0021F1778E|nr:hypothetical protein [Pseudomonas capsici]MCV4340457.1 hypothetical protein [Pseudomonas capsici]